ncbi:MAG: cysteine--tRNA ligase [Acidimicrobiales bacterium]
MLRFYDTLTAQKRDFVPRTPGEVSLYSCGPTVYDVPHIGHARTALTYDVLVRYLRWTGLKVTYAANVTDIDDNIIARAKREGSTEPEIAATYEAAYISQLDRLAITHPDHRTRATEYIDQMIAVIEKLIDRKMAYVLDSGVYFDVSQLPDYGALVNRSIDDLREGAGARVEVDDEKNDPLDFALWKSAKPGEPTWPSPWGPGRPGWHIECVAMALGILGPGFDIHGGGTDLAFPHHENERAEAVGTGQEFARNWIHSAMVNVDGEKMSKSLGNFTTLDDFLNNYDPRAMRLLMLQTHYRKTMEVNAEAMGVAAEGLSRFDSLARNAEAANVEAGDADSNILAEFRAAMDDDIGTPKAIATVFSTVRSANAAIANRQIDRAAVLVATVVELLEVLGLGRIDQDPSTDNESGEIDSLIAERAEARASKDFATSDRIRDELASRGIVIEDTAGGTTWHRS